MKFRFVGTEPSNVFGFDWVNGTVHEIEDAHAIAKMMHSAYFEAVDAPAPEAPEDVFDDYVKAPPKRRGRPPKAEVANGDAD